MTARRNQKGLAYVEALLAALLLVICLIPGLQAIGGNTARISTLPDVARDIECIHQAMEKTLSEPYNNLLAASTSGTAIPSPNLTYSLAADATCPRPRNIYIRRYDPRLSDPFATSHAELLHLVAEIPPATRQVTLVSPKN